MAKKMNYNITVIIPLNDLENLELLDKAIASVPKGIDVIISCKKDTDVSQISNKGNVITESLGDTFQELVNAGVVAVKTDWFSILEFDDTYTDIWFDNVRKEIEDNGKKARQWRR